MDIPETDCQNLQPIISKYWAKCNLTYTHIRYRLKTFFRNWETLLDGILYEYILCNFWQSVSGISIKSFILVRCWWHALVSGVAPSKFNVGKRTKLKISGLRGTYHPKNISKNYDVQINISRFPRAVLIRGFREISETTQVPKSTSPVAKIRL